MFTPERFASASLPRRRASSETRPLAPTSSAEAILRIIRTPGFWNAYFKESGAVRERTVTVKERLKSYMARRAADLRAAAEKLGKKAADLVHTAGERYKELPVWLKNGISLAFVASSLAAGMGAFGMAGLAREAVSAAGTFIGAQLYLLYTAPDSNNSTVRWLSRHPNAVSTLALVLGFVPGLARFMQGLESFEIVLAKEGAAVARAAAA